MAFDALYTRCSPYLAFICQKLCANKEDAEEVVQDTFVIAYKKADTLRAETLVAYLRKVAIRECYRKRRIHPLVYAHEAEEIIETQEEVDTDFLPEEYLHNKEQRAELLRIIMALPQMQWETVYLYYYASLSSEEIAEMQGCSTSNVRKTLRAARVRIKDHLEGKKRKHAPKTSLFVLAGTIPLAALFVAEEQAFAAVYVAAAAPCWATAGVVGAVATTTTASAAGYVMAACVAAFVAASAVTYYFMLSDLPVYSPVESPPVVQVVQYVPTTTPPISTEAPTPLPTLPQPTEPQPIATEPAPTEPPPAETQPPTPLPTDPPLTPVIVSDPMPVDRTADILAALANAHDAHAIASIIDYFGFAFAQAIRDGDERHRFYATNEGSGDIFVGIAACEDGAFDRMRFAHFYGHSAPSDLIQLLDFMKGGAG
ncbi:MAG: sigma-70 family RNA polymerase sigma factor [Defluviitaleaceae bacterium]|nr:sigma-70 family RNA polymerase sigma factor [Defluviitaleaceae bacterium]